MTIDRIVKLTYDLAEAREQTRKLAVLVDALQKENNALRANQRKRKRDDLP